MLCYTHLVNAVVHTLSNTNPNPNPKPNHKNVCMYCLYVDVNVSAKKYTVKKRDIGYIAHVQDKGLPTFNIKCN